MKKLDRGTIEVRKAFSKREAVLALAADKVARAAMVAASELRELRNPEEAANTIASMFKLARDLMEASKKNRVQSLIWLPPSSKEEA